MDLTRYTATVLIAIAGLLALLIMIRWQRSHPLFDLSDLVTGDNGRVSLSKIAQAVALSVSTWGFVILVQQGKLTEVYFLGYMTIWSGTKLLQSFVDKQNPTP